VNWTLVCGVDWREVPGAESLWRSREFAVPSDAVLELTFHHGITAYDGEFVVLAKQLGMPLVTFDKPVRKAFPNIAISAEEFLNHRCDSSGCRLSATKLATKMPEIGPAPHRYPFSAESNLKTRPRRLLLVPEGSASWKLAPRAVILTAGQ
jgi:hypothetical protein